MACTNASATTFHVKTAERGIASKLEKSKFVMMVKAKRGITKRKNVTGKWKATVN